MIGLEIMLAFFIGVAVGAVLVGILVVLS